MKPLSQKWNTIGCLLTCACGMGAGCEPVSAKLCTRNGAGVHYVHAAWTASSCTGESQMVAPAPALWGQPPAPPGPHCSLSTEASTSGTPATQISLTDINCNLHRLCIYNTTATYWQIVTFTGSASTIQLSLTDINCDLHRQCIYNTTITYWHKVWPA
jgi:hypothetical protein